MNILPQGCESDIIGEGMVITKGTVEKVSGQRLVVENCSQIQQTGNNSGGQRGLTAEDWELYPWRYLGVSVDILQGDATEIQCDRAPLNVYINHWQACNQSKRKRKRKTKQNKKENTRIRKRSSFFLQSTRLEPNPLKILIPQVLVIVFI